MAAIDPGAAEEAPSPPPVDPIFDAVFAAGSPNRLRRGAARAAAWLFSPPFLPGGLVWFALAVQAALGLTSLMKQPPEYWAARENAATYFLFGSVLRSGPLAFVAAFLAYLLVTALMLSVLNRRAALVLWFVQGLYTLDDFGSAGWCGITNASQPFSPQVCDLNRVLTLGVYVVVWGLAFSAALTLFRRQEEAAGRAGLGIPAALAAALALTGLWILLAAGLALQRASAPQPTWRMLQPAHVPSQRTSFNLAYDTQRGQAVLFGGTASWNAAARWVGKDDTWVWDGQDWIEKQPPTHPSARLEAAMAFDEQRGRVVLFGGKDQDIGLGDTWEWDGENWLQMEPALSPPARCDAQMVYDPTRQKMVLLGGYLPDLTPPAMTTVFYKDAWEWDGQQWSEIPLQKSTALAGFALAADPFHERLLIYGNDSQWEVKDGSVYPSRDAFLPAGAYSVGLAQDPGQQAVFVFGGWHAEKYRNETWKYDGSRWKRVYTAAAPSERAEAGLFYDQQRGRIVLFGGYDGKTYFTDTWELVIP